MTQLCQLAQSWRGADPPAAALCETKHDGWRALHAYAVDRVPRLYTRNGMRIEGTGHIMTFLAAMERAAGEPMIFDGEFVVDDGTGDTLRSTKAWCERAWKAGGEAGKLYLFDGLAREQWRAGGTPIPLIERKERLAELHSAALADLGNDWTWREGLRGCEAHLSAVELVDHVHVFSADDVIAQASAVWSLGGEGVVIKDMMAPYQRRRSPNWLKVGRPWRDKIAA